MRATPPTRNASWNHFTVLLQRTSDDERGDPDLFGLWTSGGAAKAPDPSGHGFDFQDTSSASHPTILKSVKRPDAQGSGWEGAYLCVRAYGAAPITFTLHATLTPCPASFDAATATPLQCQTAEGASEKERRYSECSAEGECMCTGPYERPVPTVFEGIGYEDWWGRPCWQGSILTPMALGSGQSWPALILTAWQHDFAPPPFSARPTPRTSPRSS